jgi:hypothetical protein
MAKPMMFSFESRSLKIRIPTSVASARIPTFNIGKKLLPSNPVSKILIIR